MQPKFLEDAVKRCLWFKSDLCERADTEFCILPQPLKNKCSLWLPFVSIHALQRFQLDCAVLHSGLMLCANSLSSPTATPVSSCSHCNRQSAACPWAWRTVWRLPTRASAGRGSWAKILGESPNRIYLPWKERLERLESTFFLTKLHLLNTSATEIIIPQFQ